jgi:hypothetical protein
MTIDWHGPVNQLLFGLTHATRVTDEEVDFLANSAVNHTTLGLGPQTYYEAISGALDSGDDLANFQLPQFDHDAIAEFLRAVKDRLDALRPWPERRFHRLDPATWNAFDHAVPVARLDASSKEATNVLHETFDRVGDPPEALKVLVIGLATGETVALVGQYGPGATVTLLADPAEDATATVEHFIAATGSRPTRSWHIGLSRNL